MKPLCIPGLTFLLLLVALAMSASATATATYDFDAAKLGVRTRAVFTGRLTTTNTYDDAGFVVQRRSAGAQTNTLKWDAAGRLVRRLTSLQGNQTLVNIFLNFFSIQNLRVVADRCVAVRVVAHFREPVRDTFSAGHRFLQKVCYSRSQQKRKEQMQTVSSFENDRTFSNGSRIVVGLFQSGPKLGVYFGLRSGRQSPGDLRRRLTVGCGIHVKFHFR